MGIAAFASDSNVIKNTSNEKPNLGGKKNLASKNY